MFALANSPGAVCMRNGSDVAVSVPCRAAAKDRLFGVYSGGLELGLTATAGRRFREGYQGIVPRVIGRNRSARCSRVARVELPSAQFARWMPMQRSAMNNRNFPLAVCLLVGGMLVNKIPPRPIIESRGSMVPETGLEPVLPCGKRILSTLGKGGESIFI